MNMRPIVPANSSFPGIEERSMKLSIAAALCATLAGFIRLDEERRAVPALAEPVRIAADGRPIAADNGHAAPCVHDVDRDGKKDLLVGQFGGGTCRVYRNVGTNSAPVFKEFELLLAGGAPARMSPG
jgi:hypothetical protein